MFGFFKKKEPVQRVPEVIETTEKTAASPEKNALLELKNIRLGCKAMPKEEVIRQMGQILYESGYVSEAYVDAMLKREESFSTNIGNGIALPHGVEESRKEIRRSGIAVMVFPEGTSWGTENVKLVIGVAGAGDEHLEILSIIAEKMSEPEAVEKLIAGTKEEIYRTFTVKGEY